jgi:hypothetical protein
METLKEAVKIPLIDFPRGREIQETTVTIR